MRDLHGLYIHCKYGKVARYSLFWIASKALLRLLVLCYINILKRCALFLYSILFLVSKRVKLNYGTGNKCLILLCRETRLNCCYWCHCIVILGWASTHLKIVQSGGESSPPMKRPIQSWTSCLHSSITNRPTMNRSLPTMSWMISYPIISQREVLSQSFHTNVIDHFPTNW